MPLLLTVPGYRSSLNVADGPGRCRRKINEESEEEEWEVVSEVF